MPKSEPKDTTKTKAEQTADMKAEAKRCQSESSPKPFRGDRTGGDWEVSNRVGSRKQMRRERWWKQMYKAFLRQRQWPVALQNTMAVGSTPASVCGGGAAET